MAKPPRRRPPAPAASAAPKPRAAASTATAAPRAAFPFPLTPGRVWLLAVALLLVHAALAASSLVRENPTVDEVAHLPAGISYWQTGVFKLYHHNPPLIKLAAALPVVLAWPETAELYGRPAWTSNAPDHSTFAYEFALTNAPRYFELFTRARLIMPLFSILGGLVVFLWSKRLYGSAGGLLSLALWCLCPNVLAHARLVTTDVGATALGLAATFLFWRYLKAPTWRWAAAAGLCLGAAELAKFSMILLYGLWPAIWLLHTAGTWQRAGWAKRVGRSAAQGILIVALSVLGIDAGYGFEGVGLPLGSRHLEFASRVLTRPIPPGRVRPRSPNPLLDGAWHERENRFRGTLLAGLPAPLPKHYLLGFDEQKIESEGIPKRWMLPLAERPGPGAGDEELTGYPVYLDGQLRRTGWRSYYFWAALYKVPEGTWVLVVLSLAVLAGSARARAAWVDEAIVLGMALAIVLSMSFLTDINLGLRYVLPIFPYLFISAGKLAPWAAGFGQRGKRLAAGLVVGLALLATAAATATIHPHYLAYFNWASGGPDRGSEHLIDSNLDWGQDLVNLRDWVETHAPGQRVGLAYFGQINPVIFQLRGEPFDWFLPPAAPGTMKARTRSTRLVGPAPRLEPGLYAVSATLLRGLPWRLYDPSLYAPGQAWAADWCAFCYFQQLTPIGNVGYSIFLYRLSAADIERIERMWQTQARQAAERAQAGVAQP